MPMPTEPMAEPTLEELSAYLDHELDLATETRVAEHLATCAECKLRLDGLRETAYAVRALAMETPPRTFTIPEQRRQPFRWAPVGWVGGVAAAFLLVALGVTQLHGPGASTATTSGGLGQGAAPVPAAGLHNQGTADQNTASRAFASANSTTIADPRNASRTMTLSTDAKSYSAQKGAITVDVEFTGLAQDGTTVLILYLERNGYGVLLQTGSVPLDIHGFHRSYTLANLALTDPVPGSYTLIAIEQLPGSNGEMLVARLPITLQQ
jgi:predicted anti-sigma-YlaC factor YlaD